jgi:hypothetical protein
MKSLFIKFVTLAVFVVLSSFGLVEYHSIKTKANFIQTDSTGKSHNVRMNKNLYTTSKQKSNASDSTNESEESTFKIDDVVKYLIVGIKTVITACFKIVLSF